MISKIDNKYNKKKAYKRTKQVNVSLINFALGLILLSKISNYLMINFLLSSPVVVLNFAIYTPLVTVLIGIWMFC
jgi:hypothetical protein